MISRRTCRDEAFELLFRSTFPQLEELSNELQLPTEQIPWRSTPAQCSSAIWGLIKKRAGSAASDLDDILRRQQGKSKPLYLFYITCSETDRADPRSQIFFDALISRINKTIPDRELRYLDEGNREDPTTWSPWTLRGLAEAQVLICLYSSAFFRSLYCGRVWRAFLTRLDNCRKSTINSPYILPVLWGAPSDNPNVLPKVARDLTFKHSNLGTLYVKNGLRFLLEQAEASRYTYTQAYDECMDRLAALVIQRAQTNSLPVGRDIASLDSFDSVFPEPTDENDGETRIGTEVANFIFFAAKKTEISPLRDSEGYGEQSGHWCPYHPDNKLRIETVGNLATSDAGIDMATIPFDEQFVQRLRSADERDNIILTLVDPWTMRLRAYGEYAKKYDEADLFKSAVLICWNGNDQDTKRYRSALKEALPSIFPHKYRLGSAAGIRPEIDNYDQLRIELANALVGVRREIVDQIPAARPVLGQSFIRPGANFIAPSALPPAIAVRSGDVRSAENKALGSIGQPRLEGPSGVG
jgi:FxsC-like protein